MAKPADGSIIEMIAEAKAMQFLNKGVAMIRWNSSFWRKILAGVFLLVLATLLKMLPLPPSNASGMLRAMIHLLLLMTWGISIQERIIQHSVRRNLYMVYSMIVVWILIRTVKYQFTAKGTPENRIFWYLYYVPFLLIPVFCLLAAICIGKPENYRIPKKYDLLFLPALFLIVMVLTNDRHQLAFTFPHFEERGYAEYRYGAIYWAAAAWILILGLITLVMVIRKSHVPGSLRIIWLPIVVFCLGPAYAVLYYLQIANSVYLFSDMPFFFCLCIAMDCESWIQSGMILSNSHYGELFNASAIAAQITDPEGSVCYMSKRAKMISPGLIEKAEKAQVLIDDHTRLGSKAIPGGHVLWEDDMSATNRILSELQAVRSQLSENNVLLKAEAELKAKQLKIDEANRLYDRIARKTQKQLNELDEILEELSASGTEFRRKMEYACIIGAYIKRASNLVLIGEKQAQIPVRELQLGIEESLYYVRMSGITCALQCSAGDRIAAEKASMIYDWFEEELENALPGLTDLQVTLFQDGSRLTAGLIMRQPDGVADPSWRRDELEKYGAKIQERAAGDSRMLELGFRPAAGGTAEKGGRS
ncbi:MAG: hypothetical protein LKJ76_01055 [Lachnospiraceae bacterium]|nr:hypothetical protein [Lachnospiraceae bacterium]